MNQQINQTLNKSIIATPVNISTKDIDPTPKYMDEIVVFCPDCRGKFEIDPASLEEGEVFSCPLCMADLQVTSLNPFKVRLFDGDMDF